MEIEREQRAAEIQDSIRQILFRDWDPIGVSEVPEAQDEYDSYVGGVYRLLASGASEDEIIGHLYRIESDTMGMPAADREGLRAVAGKLTKLSVSL